MEPTDDELIGRFRRGDGGAFDRLVARWDRRVLGFAYRLTRDVEEAQDIRQAVFLRTYRALESFNGHARFSTWIHQVTLNLCRDRARSIESQERALAGGARAREPETGVLPSPLETSERNELSRVVATAIAALPEAEREVVVLRHYQGLAFPEIAEILDAPVSTVKSRMSQGLTHLRDRLGHLNDATS